MPNGAAGSKLRRVRGGGGAEGQRCATVPEKISNLLYNMLALGVAHKNMDEAEYPRPSHQTILNVLLHFNE